MPDDGAFGDKGAHMGRHGICGRCGKELDAPRRARGVSVQPRALTTKQMKIGDTELTCQPAAALAAMQRLRHVLARPARTFPLFAHDPHAAPGMPRMFPLFAYVRTCAKSGNMRGGASVVRRWCVGGASGSRSAVLCPRLTASGCR